MLHCVTVENELSNWERLVLYCSLYISSHMHIRQKGIDAVKKQLHLKKVTIRTLDESILKEVAGGGTVGTCAATCAYSCGATCTCSGCSLTGTCQCSGFSCGVGCC